MHQVTRLPLPGILPMALSGFHPLVALGFTEMIGEPTSAQQRGWPRSGTASHVDCGPNRVGQDAGGILTAIDDLVREGWRARFRTRSASSNVSPLKALSADIHKNLAEPRRGIRHLAQEAGVEAPRLTAAVRTGDTTQSERAAILRTPPHILVTTPESLYLMLTAERSRDLLRTVRTGNRGRDPRVMARAAAPTSRSRWSGAGGG